MRGLYSHCELQLFKRECWRTINPKDKARYHTVSDSRQGVNLVERPVMDRIHIVEQIRQLDAAIKHRNNGDNSRPGDNSIGSMGAVGQGYG